MLPFYDSSVSIVLVLSLVPLFLYNKCPDIRFVNDSLRVQQLRKIVGGVNGGLHLDMTQLLAGSSYSIIRLL